jgi:hypothetical protein
MMEGGFAPEVHDPAQAGMMVLWQAPAAGEATLAELAPAPREPPGPPPGQPPASAIYVAEAPYTAHPPAPGVPLRQYGHVQWWSPPPPTEPAQRPARTWVPPPRNKLTTLGWMKHQRDPSAPFFEWHYLKCIHWYLTERWWILQSGTDREALGEWRLVMQLLELDLKAHRDLILLAQSGLVGRTCANMILWKLLTGAALDGSCEDLSHLVTHEVSTARRSFDRPPRGHPDLTWWTWTYYQWPSHYKSRWGPGAVPHQRNLAVGRGGEPLPPPACWGAGMQ